MNVNFFILSYADLQAYIGAEIARLRAINPRTSLENRKLNGLESIDIYDQRHPIGQSRNWSVGPPPTTDEKRSTMATLLDALQHATDGLYAKHKNAQQRQQARDSHHDIFNDLTNHAGVYGKLDLFLI